MPGQPNGFTVAMVIPTEPAATEAPATIVEMGDSITLKAYLHCDQSMAPIYKHHVQDHLTGDYGEVEYHLQDLETGAMVPTKHGPTKPAPLPATDVAIAFGGNGTPTTPGVVQGDLQGSGLPTDGVYYISAPTAAITTGDAGSAKDLELPSKDDDSGTWRILAHAHGGPGSLVSAFNDDCIILVERIL